MYFIDQRVQVLCNQLERLRFLDSTPLNDWQYKHGQYFHPDEADKNGPPWEDFDCATMRWYSTYAGTDQFEGKFKGHGGDFKGIPGEHYWFRGRVTIPEKCGCASRPRSRSGMTARTPSFSSSSTACPSRART